MYFIQYLTLNKSKFQTWFFKIINLEKPNMVYLMDIMLRLSYVIHKRAIEGGFCPQKCHDL